MKLHSALVVAGAVLTLFVPAVAQADTPKLSHVTTVGVHNTYDPAAYPYLAQALDNGSSLIELDVWPDFFTHEWKVSHSNPFGNGNNCVDAPDLYSGGANKDLESCLDDIRVWLGAHPGHSPITLKLEMKTGFSANTGLGPEQLDAALRDHLGSAVFKPADLLGGYGTLDEASKADNWPSVDALRGKVITEIIPGTVEENNPTDTLRTDVEYCRYLLAQKASGKLDSVQIFPTVHGAAAGDPRDQYSAEQKPWFVVFDGDASEWLAKAGMSWYDDNHYYVVMTDAQNVAPAIDDRNPTVDQANQRVVELARQHASVVTSDWTGLSTVLPQVDPRG
ncbi:phosphatidylinositol-specific phospholipase C domain-containing protein [Amycolatopsis jejuensis]|uniref:phosphatidylinositol-specific phospholipase C domain-containing protein n=1 Tax=Amycolatopsis jejuensis TaxID=330084 RepID=UPI0005246F51|nr:phosphatidylinositol-specific phospholipase C domain-containing protein [Amycolatopsis jejuensis]